MSRDDLDAYEHMQHDCKHKHRGISVENLPLLETPSNDDLLMVQHRFYNPMFGTYSYRSCQITLGQLSLGGSGGTENYNDLINKPTLNGNVIQGNLELKTVGGETIIGTGDIPIGDLQVSPLDDVLVNDTGTATIIVPWKDRISGSVVQYALSLININYYGTNIPLSIELTDWVEIIERVNNPNVELCLCFNEITHSQPLSIIHSFGKASDLGAGIYVNSVYDLSTYDLSTYENIFLAFIENGAINAQDYEFDLSKTDFTVIATFASTGARTILEFYQDNASLNQDVKNVDYLQVVGKSGFDPSKMKANIPLYTNTSLRELNLELSNVLDIGNINLQEARQVNLYVDIDTSETNYVRFQNSNPKPWLLKFQNNDVTEKHVFFKLADTNTIQKIFLPPERGSKEFLIYKDSESLVELTKDTFRTSHNLTISSANTQYEIGELVELSQRDIGSKYYIFITGTFIPDDNTERLNYELELQSECMTLGYDPLYPTKYKNSFYVACTSSSSSSEDLTFTLQEGNDDDPLRAITVTSKNKTGLFIWNVSNVGNSAARSFAARSEVYTKGNKTFQQTPTILYDNNFYAHVFEKDIDYTKIGIPVQNTYIRITDTSPNTNDWAIWINDVNSNNRICKLSRQNNSLVWENYDSTGSVLQESFTLLDDQGNVPIYSSLGFQTGCEIGSYISKIENRENLLTDVSFTFIMRIDIDVENALKGDIGNLETLEKRSIVDALNETFDHAFERIDYLPSTQDVGATIGSYNFLSFNGQPLTVGSDWRFEYSDGSAIYRTSNQVFWTEAGGTVTHTLIDLTGQNTADTSVVWTYINPLYGYVWQMPFSGTQVVSVTGDFDSGRSELKFYVGYDVSVLHQQVGIVENLETNEKNLTGAVNELRSELHTQIPIAPMTDGTYTLQCEVVGGVPTYSWV